MDGKSAITAVNLNFDATVVKAFILGPYKAKKRV